MQPDWQRAYSELSDYITSHPEIKIGTSVVKIPNEYSSNFYSLHTKARTAFIDEKKPDLLEKSKILSNNYLKVEEEVIRLIGLQNIYVAPSLNNFLHNPIDQLIKEIYTPFFGLLKGQLDSGKYEEVAIGNIEYFFKTLYRSGYEKWVILSLVNLLKADKVFKVIPEEVSEDDSFRHGGLIDYKIPDPEKSSGISFRRDDEVGFMVPDLLIHSAEEGSYYSFTSEIIKTYAVATNPSRKREWLPGDPTVVFEGGIILVYKDEHLSNLSLVTDMKRTCRADLIIECREQKDWYEKEGLEKIKLHYDKYKPKWGTYIVTLEPEPEQVKLDIKSEKAVDIITDKQGSEEQGMAINILTAGFNQKKLEPIVNILTHHNNPDQKSSRI
jgi:hypothetical protein